MATYSDSMSSRLDFNDKILYYILVDTCGALHVNLITYKVRHVSIFFVQMREINF